MFPVASSMLLILSSSKMITIAWWT